MPKPVEAYTHRTTNVAALERAGNLGMEKYPGQNVFHVVVDDEKTSREWVKLMDENLSAGEYGTCSISNAQSGPLRAF